jgi:hypothetical protein
MRCANCWEEILQPSPNSTELAIQWILRTSSIACFRPNFFFFEGSAVCPACYSILRELEPAEKPIRWIA